jgi:glycosyltransferase involved in cell wall biosynthesis
MYFSNQIDNMQHTIILCPLYKDEASFNIFAASVENLTPEIYKTRLSFLVVNDGTIDLTLKTNLPSTIVHLHRNIGHQKAIAIGLCYAHHHLSFDKIIIMDCDGEDKPGDIIRLLEKSAEGQEIVVAERVSRQESKSFQFFYSIYKAFFFVLTGRRISFGNFMLVFKRHVSMLVHYSEIWNHLAGGVIKSNLNYTSVLTHRGKRYGGTSKMKFTSLLLHGLGAIGIFIEVIASRLLIFSLLMVVVSIIAICIVLFIKFFTTQAIPGWASTAISLMLIVLLQGFSLSLITIFLYLSFQTQQKFIPALHYKDFINRIETKNNG